MGASDHPARRPYFALEASSAHTPGDRKARNDQSTLRPLSAGLRRSDGRPARAGNRMVRYKKGRRSTEPRNGYLLGGSWVERVRGGPATCWPSSSLGSLTASRFFGWCRRRRRTATSAITAPRAPISFEFWNRIGSGCDAQKAPQLLEDVFIAREALRAIALVRI